MAITLYPGSYEVSNVCIDGVWPKPDNTLVAANTSPPHIRISISVYPLKLLNRNHGLMAIGERQVGGFRTRREPECKVSAISSRPLSSLVAVFLAKSRIYIPQNDVGVLDILAPELPIVRWNASQETNGVNSPAVPCYSAYQPTDALVLRISMLQSPLGQRVLHQSWFTKEI